MIKDRTKRLGASGGAKEILAHAFFKGTDVQKFESYQIKPPFVPTQKSETQYFNCNSELDETFLPSEQLQLIKTNQSAFAGFSAGAAKK